MFQYQGMIWSPTSKQIAVLLEHSTGSGNDGHGLRVFSVIKGDNYDFDRHDFEILENSHDDIDGGPQTATWNSDGTLLAVASSSKLHIYSLKDEKPLVTLSDYRVGDLKWSGDNRLIASGRSDGTIYVWGLESTGG
jgi:WD40 repeat protein